MHEDQSKKCRNIIPRWRPVARTVALGEANASSGFLPADPMLFTGAEVALTDALATFDDNPGVAFAAEAVATAILSGFPEAAKAPARRVLGARELSSGLASLAESCLNPGTQNPQQAPISLTSDHVRLIRARMHNGYVGPYAWLDLALAYTSIGNQKKAERALKVARGLMREPTRLLLRAEVRFYQHADKSDRALDLLLREPEQVVADPWLLAAEIGLHRLVGKPSKNLKKASNVLKSDIMPFHLSELAAAVGTEELMAGSHKKARLLFQAAVFDPAEQGLAQTVWAGQLDKRIVIPKMQALRHSSEARAREAMARFRWRLVAKSCRDWVEEEPFATSPAIILTGTLSVFLGDLEGALKAADQGLINNPENLVLRNNKAFILAKLDRFEEATKILSEIIPLAHSDSENSILVGATLGLTLLRSGMIDEGRRFYRQAYDLARVLDRKNNGNHALRVAIFFVAEVRALGVIDHETDATMMKVANPDKLQGELAELHKALKRYVRRPRLSRDAFVHGLVRGVLDKVR